MAIEYLVGGTAAAAEMAVDNRMLADDMTVLIGGGVNMTNTIVAAVEIVWLARNN